MAKKKQSEREQLQTQAGREMSVYKRDDMVQKARLNLSAVEQKCVLFAISKIKPTDTAFQEYTFELSHFYALCGYQKESYHEVKAILKGLSDKSWWATIDDKGTESLIRWFSTLRTNKKSGKVTVKFHEDMMPFLLELAKQAEMGEYYTGYSLQYILPMSSQYSPRLYELLKSYQKNNREWFFNIEELKRILDAQSYDRWPDFRRRILEPAVNEINEYSDLNVAYDTEKEGRKVTRVIFYMAGKGQQALLAAKKAGSEKLDGQVTLDEIMKVIKEDSVKKQFFRENR